MPWYVGYVVVSMPMEENNVKVGISPVCPMCGINGGRNYAWRRRDARLGEKEGTMPCLVEMQGSVPGIGWVFYGGGSVMVAACWSALSWGEEQHPYYLTEKRTSDK